ncbi:hypothetical protein SARC_03598 [Sphaeroforma arctica JP610]|uniref:Fatty acid hydroxylase domain-containing protein n=1 Tax=Sphaeroforma arctica JP610 TaxID=667725 RepID=A0A0L0G5R9_9EUKA|nr:hypothetical protein SARC_03598 [Sphaeroforma arctica JP610]KNC84176.1 hypothetical protein SARC_03598 [Sphaeroforma arctica JP610]|eukprot:XP_014158078.1 hypothetical protein SARC_03598 [Sphaeroforma arctica JP610]
MGIAGSSHHTDHHLYFNYNYGQFFTLWDRVGGSHRNPTLTKTKLMDKDLNVKDTPVAEQDELKSVFKDDANFLAACSPQDLNVKDTPVAEQDVFKDDAHLLSDAAAHKKEE